MTTPMSPTQRLAQVSREYSERAQEYAQIATEAAVREATQSLMVPLLRKRR